MKLVLTDPLFFLGVLGLLGVLLRLRARRFGNVVILLAVVLLYGLSTPLVSAVLRTSIGATQPVALAAGEEGPAAIVVLGGDIRQQTADYGDDTVGRLTLERLRYGAALQRQTGLPILVTGGPVGFSQRSLSSVMKQTLEDEFQVSVRWVDEQAGTTYENARFAAELLAADGIDRVYLVTHAIHMPRAVEAFEHWNLEVTPAPTVLPRFGGTIVYQDLLPSTRALLASRYALYEWLGRVWYRYVHYQP